MIDSTNHIINLIMMKSWLNFLRFYSYFIKKTERTTGKFRKHHMIMTHLQKTSEASISKDGCGWMSGAVLQTWRALKGKDVCMTCLCVCICFECLSSCTPSDPESLLSMHHTQLRSNVLQIALDVPTLMRNIRKKVSLC